MSKKQMMGAQSPKETPATTNRVTTAELAKLMEGLGAKVDGLGQRMEEFRAADAKRIEALETRVSKLETANSSPTPKTEPTPTEPAEEAGKVNEEAKAPEEAKVIEPVLAPVKRHGKTGPGVAFAFTRADDGRDEMVADYWIAREYGIGNESKIFVMYEDGAILRKLTLDECQKYHLC